MSRVGIEGRNTTGTATHKCVVTVCWLKLNIYTRCGESTAAMDFFDNCQVDVGCIIPIGHQSECGIQAILEKRLTQPHSVHAPTTCKSRIGSSVQKTFGLIGGEVHGTGGSPPKPILILDEGSFVHVHVHEL